MNITKLNNQLFSIKTSKKLILEVQKCKLPTFDKFHECIILKVFELFKLFILIKHSRPILQFIKMKI